MEVLLGLAFLVLIPIVIYWGFRLAWWLFRVALVAVLMVVALIGHAWRGELD
jgi:hypothetical protein